MRTMHPTLLIGPADWDAQRMPRAEFQGRLDALWRDHPQAGGVIVYGDAADHGALAYLTNFTPKLEPGIALLSRSGEAALLVGGGINMIPAAKPLTWVEKMLPLRSIAKSVPQWAMKLAGGTLLVGGDAMPYAMHGELFAALGTAPEDATPTLQSHRRRKSVRELSLIRQASTVPGKAAQALALARDRNVTDAVIAAEYAAWQAGAQDVRSLFSLDGGRSLVPFDVPVAEPADPMQVYLAVRVGGYWAEGFVMLGAKPNASLDAAKSALQAAVAQLRPGVTPATLTQTLTKSGTHPAALPAVIGIGLAVQEDLPLNEPLAAGTVLSLRAGVLGEHSGVIVSALVAVTETGSDVLWSAP